MWFDVLKSNVYYYVTSSDYAKVVIDTQTIPVEQKTAMELPWVKEQFEPPIYKAGEPVQILFWKDLDEAKLYAKHEGNSETVIVRCEIETKLNKWPRDILVHTPKHSNVRGPLLKSAYAYFGNEDIEGKFEVI
tara:strand:- start:938 stop:1336 length:399 start_codon:yes stop_codon:yes gene_type:complete